MPAIPPPRAPDLAKIAAQRAGQKKYQGNDCRRKHGGTRYSSNGQCVVCLEMHKERYRAKAKGVGV